MKNYYIHKNNNLMNYYKPIPIRKNIYIPLLNENKYFKKNNKSYHYHNIINKYNIINTYMNNKKINNDFKQYYIIFLFLFSIIFLFFKYFI